jgi:hypothetical protein
VRSSVAWLGARIKRSPLNAAWGLWAIELHGLGRADALHGTADRTFRRYLTREGTRVLQVEENLENVTDSADPS